LTPGCHREESQEAPFWQDGEDRKHDQGLTVVGHLAKYANASNRRKTMMNSKNQAKYEARAKIIKAMAHPTRLFIIDELAGKGERCVCELTEMIGTDMSTVSRHLAMLKGAGIIEDDKRGASVYYRLRICCVSEFLECVESVIKRNARDQQRLLA
jgi:DNA-binding transcriptional ArsR family regulator